MRKIEYLEVEEKITLEEGFRNSIKAHFRRKCHSILLSNEGYTVSEIAKLYNVRTRTIYTWFNSWETSGISGLISRLGRGLKAKLDTLTKEELEEVKLIIKETPQSLKKVCKNLSEVLGFKVTKHMLKRLLKKKLNYSWRRLKKCIKKLQNPKEYQAKLEELKSLLLLEKQGEIDIYFGDETGVSLTPTVPYGWQEINQPILIKTERSKRLNIFGLMTQKNDLEAYSFYGSATGQLIIAFIDNFAKKITKKTVIVLDNATIRHSIQFHEKIKEWKALNIEIFYLPTYSPNLNIIETLWRKIKHEWLQAKDYESLETLEIAIDKIILKFGIEFNINFSV